MFAPTSPAQEKTVEKPVMPSLDAKEWVKQKSGLEIWDAKEGKGDAVKAGATVKVHYSGWLTNGEIFDSSVVRGEPIEFPLTGVIKGWQEGIPGMKPGGVRRLKIPAELAYGDRAKGKIPANSTLIFEVEMLEATAKPELPDLKAKEWKKLDNGLEVWDVKEGTGEAVKAGGTVTVFYTGWLTNGKEFDSNVGGKPISFPLGGVIKGWGLGIPGMKPGGVRRLKIPAELGYGKEGAGDDIPPNSVLVFEVQLVK
ncbi:MAG: FKBP-type peptidyl-prolyl cis-trans isomerase [Planctomycetes bacterium]|nr:FKBP-type peptidyl-prolyl cis-trans isomerase [Planctomycetota bacterium]